MDSFQKIFPLSMSHAATSGVTFHRTAPVVPASAFERSRPGDCLMAKSCDPMATSIENAVLSMMPRLSEGISCEKTRNVSFGPVSRITWYQRQKRRAPSSASSICSPRALVRSRLAEITESTGPSGILRRRARPFVCANTRRINGAASSGSQGSDRCKMQGCYQPVRIECYSPSAMAHSLIALNGISSVSPLRPKM
jgi:hypothetical protein